MWLQVTFIELPVYTFNHVFMGSILSFACMNQAKLCRLEFQCKPVHDDSAAFGCRQNQIKSANRTSADLDNNNLRVLHLI